MPLDREQAAERQARIDMILEELRLNTEDMQELATQATKRARQMRDATRLVRERARQRREASRK